MIICLSGYQQASSQMMGATGRCVRRILTQDGLYVAVSVTGAISFRYNYRLNGRSETLTFGRYGVGGVTLAESTRDMRRSLYERDLKPFFVNRLLHEITEEDVRSRADAILQRGVPATAVLAPFRLSRSVPKVAALICGLKRPTHDAPLVGWEKALWINGRAKNGRFW